MGVVIAIPDITRPLSPHATLEPLLRRLAGEAAHIEVLVALGLHRRMTHEECRDLLDICTRYGARLTQHDAHDPRHLITLSDDVTLLPESPLTLPVVLHRALYKTDRIICLGLVEPHQYAGYSGGVKTVAIGCAGAATIGALHGLTLLREPLTALGVVEGNPFRAGLERVASCLSAPIEALQVVPSPDAPHVSYGPVQLAFETARAVAAATLFEAHTRQYDWALLRVPTSKGSSFYQASRAASYIGLVGSPVVRRGGWLLIEAACEEGVGQGAGEEACARAMLRGRQVLAAELRGDRVPAEDAATGGAQRAYVLARLLDGFQVGLIGASPALPELAAMGIAQWRSFEEARDAIGLHDEEGLVVKDPFHAVPHWAG